VDTGQDVADYLLERGDVSGALTLIDQRLLPLASDHNLTDMIVPLRFQRAVVLAYAGDIPAARAEINTVAGYDLSPHAQRQITNHKDLIERIAALSPPSPG
jgi:GTP-binding protein EngB required for normal cell division